ncbi:hypothetical protein CEXT_775561 [Caerostris extrusa]|uniref:Uncharacterized protein n=1 Tax=Caerostris extrusa TaxID=172846 RepID=A0AAV4RFH2_CAEEX|nr:hypothetical protein CEXT_775561 [Caerostris extrusa]
MFSIKLTFQDLFVIVNKQKTSNREREKLYQSTSRTSRLKQHKQINNKKNAPPIGILTRKHTRGRYMYAESVFIQNSYFSKPSESQFDQVHHLKKYLCALCSTKVALLMQETDDRVGQDWGW